MVSLGLANVTDNLNTMMLLRARDIILLLYISGLITASSCFSSNMHDSYSSIPKIWGKIDRRAHTIEREDEDQLGMKEAFESLDSISSTCLEAPAWKTKPKTQLKYSRTDDTQALYFGKSSEDEVVHYLDMQRELEADESHDMQDESSANDNKDGDALPDFSDEHNKNNVFDFDQNSQHPWNSINPILRLRGPVAKGYGRGGKKLGVPTANLPSSLFQSALECVDAGVYFGWAVIEGEDSTSRNIPVKAVVNVGYSPTFEGKENKEKIVEAHLITKSSPMTKYNVIMDTDQDESEDRSTDEELETSKDFYGETMRLQLLGFLRSEQKFDSFQDLIMQIHCDIGHAYAALDSFPYVFSKEDAFISSIGEAWIGSGGGDISASWEFETW